ncbi:hypothetical protein VKT23_010762 [Stygiomarasmius scandens]|uniref:Uncharacterized protein n=1 Tax=Marasmiellus scandens TaxID=2682957 RepID=A0ABR1JET6_9AGAR
MTTVWKVVDDSDSRIQYSGNWTFVSGDANLSPWSLTGDVFNKTLHRAMDNDKRFTFKFNGTSQLVVYATWTPDPTENSSHLLKTNCAVDRKDILGFVIPTKGQAFVANWQEACRADPGSLPGGQMILGEHELVVNISTPGNMGFYLDYILYETLPGASVDGEMLVIGSGAFEASKDPHLVFSPGWAVNESTSSGAMSTNTPGSNVTVKFNGTEIALYGDLYGLQNSNLATYQIDNQPPKPFPLFHPGVHVYTNQMLFNISSLSSDSEHTVVVTHAGTHDAAPLAIDYFLVHSLTAEEQSPIVSLSPGPSSPPSNHNKIGAVIGGTIGSVVAVGIMGVVLLLWMRKRKSREEVESEKPEPFMDQEFDPYSPDPTSMPLSHCQTASKYEPQLFSSNNYTSRNRDDEINMMRLGNLKLQQRLAVLQGPPAGRVAGSSNISETRTGPMVHADSGWRMVDGAAPSNPDQTDEVPPGYTAT